MSEELTSRVFSYLRARVMREINDDVDNDGMAQAIIDMIDACGLTPDQLHARPAATSLAIKTMLDYLSQFEEC